MAQHIPLTEKDEPKVYKSAKRLSKSAVRYAKGYLLGKSWNKHTIFNKEIMRLPKEYADFTKSAYAFQMGKYTLESITDVDKWLATDTPLEVHCNDNGEVTAIFWVV